MDTEVLAEIWPSIWRRLMAVAMIAALGVVLIWTGINAAGLGAVMLVIGGGGVLVLADWLRRSTQHSVQLTREVLRESSGRVLCRVEDIAAVDRGMFAFKPSNGVLIRLKEKTTRVWAPGLWWRHGKVVGIGGVTPAPQAKAMADILTLYLKDRAMFEQIMSPDP